MGIWVLFIVMRYDYSNGGVTSFQYEFKDRIQCTSSFGEITKRFENRYSVLGYCQEVRK